MRHGRQPRLPHDLHLVEDATALPQPKKEYLDALVTRMHHYHRWVVRAHARAQTKKLAYDRNQIEVNCHSGDYVLRYIPKVKTNYECVDKAIMSFNASSIL